MRKLIANTTIMVFAAVALIIIGAVVGFRAQDFSWFARFGSLVTCIGIIVISRPSITRKDILVPIVMDAQSGLTQRDPEYYLSRHEPVPDWVWQDVLSRRAVGVYGPIVTLAGTAIWGFGDLLNLPFGFHP